MGDSVTSNSLTAARVLLLVVSASSTACGIGYNRLFFMTKTNIGLDVDSKPPTAELSIARREAVIEPDFSDGNAPPVVASYRYEGNWFSPRIAQTFAGGRAAAILTAADPNTVKPDAAHACLEKKPELCWLMEKQEGVRPFFFAADTAFGLKVAWSGTTGQYPDSLKMGYNRIEFALAPVFGPESEPNSPDPNCPYPLHTPSFIGSVDNAISVVDAFSGGDRSFSQVFATGVAADNLAADSNVRGALRPMLQKGAANELTTKGAQEATERENVRGSVTEIVSIFNGDSRKQDRILAKAKELKLVPDDTTKTNFRSQLAKLEGTAAESGPDLAKLQEYAKGL